MVRIKHIPLTRIVTFVLFVFTMLLTPIPAHVQSKLYVSDDIILENPELILGQGDNQRALFYKPTAVCVDTDSNIFVLDGGNRRVVKFDSNGKYVSEFGRLGQGPGEFGDPLAMAIDRERRIIYVSDIGNGRLVVFDLNGNYLRSCNTPFLRPRAPHISITKESHILINQITDSTFITQFSPDFKLLSTFGTPTKIENPINKKFDYSCLIEVLASGEIVVFYRFHPIIQKYNKNFKLLFSKQIKNEDVDRTIKSLQSGDLPFTPSQGGVGSLVFCIAVAADMQGGCFLTMSEKVYHFDENGVQDKVFRLRENPDTETDILAEGLFVDNFNNLFIVDTFYQMEVLKFSLDGLLK